MFFSSSWLFLTLPHICPSLSILSSPHLFPLHLSGLHSMKQEPLVSYINMQMKLLLRGSVLSSDYSLSFNILYSTVFNLKSSYKYQFLWFSGISSLREVCICALWQFSAISNLREVYICGMVDQPKIQTWSLLVD